ncbi:MAG: diguanylate cyclase [Gemmatimonadaceae bacterium]
MSSWKSELTEGHVVVTESHPLVAGALSWLLRENGYAVTTVADRDALFAALDHTVPDLILLDGDVVEQDVALIGRLRDEPRWTDVRVIVTAPWAAVEDSVVLPPGVDDCVSKPFRVPELLGRMRTQLRASAQLRDARTALREATLALEVARVDAAHNRGLVDILHAVTGEVSANEIYQILSRRIARALGITHCSVVLARAGDATGLVVAAADDYLIEDVEIRMDLNPELASALETNRSVLGNGGRVAAIPFSIERWRSGALILRNDNESRVLSSADVDFATSVIRAAMAAIRRAQALENTRADNRRLAALATTDPLTRVLNRRALIDRLTAEVDRARRFDSSLSMLMLDVDHFKSVNDTVGHLAGDAVLQEIGALLEEAVRKVDIVARYGGEEFVTILPETVEEGGLVFAERLRERVAARPFDVGTDTPMYLTVSIGIASFPSARVSSTEDLFARADEALYRAKSNGRNQVCT